MPGLRRLSAALALSLLAAAALAVACGDSGEGGLPTVAPAARPADGAAPGTPGGITATATLPPRADALAGAPVEPPQVASAPFDPSRRNSSGSFPPLTDPAVISASEATWLGDDDLVLGALQGGEARAYPLSMLTFHHVANDTLGGMPYLVTF